MSKVNETWISDMLFDTLYLKLRTRYVTKRPLSTRTKNIIINDNLLTLSERERYFLRLYAVHGGSVNHVAKAADVTYKRARRTLDICIRKMLSPKCLVNARAIPEFKHFGASLSESRVMNKSTINRMAQSGIETDEDLKYWYDLGPEFLFRIPEVGNGRIVEFLSHLNDKQLI